MTASLAVLFARKGEARPVIERTLQISDPARFASLRLPFRPVAPAGREHPRARRRPARIGVTLRLDPERHELLRRSAAASGRSMQSILLEAFDAHFAVGGARRSR